MRECIFNKGQSKRIWNELFKVSHCYYYIQCVFKHWLLFFHLQVIDSSDVVVQVNQKLIWEWDTQLSFTVGGGGGGGGG